MAENKSAYRKTLDVRSPSGNLKAQYTLDLSPWEMGDRKGHTCQLRVLKLGEKPSNKFVNFDPFNKEFRLMLKEMYAEADKLEK